MNDEASSIHGNIRLSSVYISQSGEWRLGGFEVLSSMKDDDAIIYVCVLVMDYLFLYIADFRRDTEVLRQILGSMHHPRSPSQVGMRSNAIHCQR